MLSFNVPVSPDPAPVLLEAFFFLNFFQLKAWFYHMALQHLSPSCLMENSLFSLSLHATKLVFLIFLNIACSFLSHGPYWLTTVFFSKVFSWFEFILGF